MSTLKSVLWLGGVVLLFSLVLGLFGSFASDQYDFKLDSNVRQAVDRADPAQMLKSLDRWRAGYEELGVAVQFAPVRETVREISGQIQEAILSETPEEKAIKIDSARTRLKAVPPIAAEAFVATHGTWWQRYVRSVLEIVTCLLGLLVVVVGGSRALGVGRKKLSLSHTQSSSPMPNESHRSPRRGSGGPYGPSGIPPIPYGPGSGAGFYR